MRKWAGAILILVIVGLVWCVAPVHVLAIRSSKDSPDNRLRLTTTCAGSQLRCARLGATLVCLSGEFCSGSYLIEVPNVGQSSVCYFSAGVSACRVLVGDDGRIRSNNVNWFHPVRTDG